MMIMMMMMMCCPDDDDADGRQEVEATNDQQPWNDLHSNLLRYEYSQLLIRRLSDMVFVPDTKPI